VFNMGVGLVIAVPPEAATAAVTACSTPEYPAFVMGEIREQSAEEPTVTLIG
jgi:phosphoribosylaminoimidazole (AIR) synthetase